MMKRALSLFLCLIMVLSFAAPSAQASDTDDIYIADGSSVSGMNDSVVNPTESAGTDSVAPVLKSEQEVGPPVQTSPVADIVESGKVICDCGTEAEELMSHSDGCVLKRSCIDLCAQSAMDIYSRWYSISMPERDFIKEYLSQYYPDTLDTLRKIWNADMIADENDLIDYQPEVLQQHTGVASAQVGDITVDAHGIPEGSSLTVSDPSKKATNAVEDALAELGENPEQLFFYDISVQNEESDNWQPEGDSVYMTLTVPGLKLHKYQTVYVIHVDDDGNASTIQASVDENGDIAFFTDGFSTFAGFTVDFKYGGAFFSMNGLTDIKLSALLDELKMPLYASDVSDLQFSDETLVSVTRLAEEQDWLLTSLRAFKTQEALTLTMNDGNEYVINVTDATAFIWVGGGDYGKGTRYDQDGNQFCGWYADADGNLATQNTSGLSGVPNDGWKELNTIYFSGSGNFEIGIYPYTNVYSNERAYIRLNQIKVGASVHLKIYLGASFDSTSITQVHLQARSTANLFIVENGGSLELQGRAPTSTKSSPCYLVLDAWNDELREDNPTSGIGGWGLNDYTIDNQLIQMCDGATGLTCNYVQFQDAHRSAIRIHNGEGATSNNRTKTFRLTNCIFDGDVCRENTANDPATGSGGAIYLEATGANMSGTTNYTWMDEMYLENCQFNGCWAAESGGALGIYGRVKDITIKDCQFNGTYSSRGYGGAIVMAGHASTMTVTGTTFDNCSSTVAGGAIYIVSRVLWSANNTYSRLNELTLSGCTFKNSGQIANGQAINSPLGGAVSLDTSINKVTIDSCTFTDLKATEGGGLCFGYTNLTAKNANGVHAYMSNDNFSTTCNATQAPPGDEGTDGSDYYRTTIGPTTITNCEFLRVTGETQGGAVRFRTNSTVKSVTMDNVNFDSCEAVQAGSAVMLGDTIIPSFTYKNSIIQNCKTTMTSSDEVGGSFRTIGKTTCNASLTNIQFLNNSSHCSGGGVYWNAAGVRYIESGKPITTMIALDQCMFDGNKAGWYGGGIYCESVMTVTKCELKNNVSVKMGGGIAMQLYNNTVRPFTDGEVTTLTLDAQTNIHHNQSKVGGGISIRANATLAIDNTKAYKHTVQFVLGGAQVHHNYATTDGGGVWFNVETYNTSTETGAANQQEVERFDKIINLNSGSVYSNTAGGNGGGIFMNGGIVTDPENTATTGLSCNGMVTINLSGAAIYDNEAGRSCSGVTTSAEDVLPPVISVTKGTDGNIKFTKSAATGGNGGGIYMYGNTGVCYISGGVIGALKKADGTPGEASKNIASRGTDISVGGNGGGIAIFGEGRIEMEGGHVVNNTADTAGGGIAVHDRSSMYLSGGNINNNTSHIGGGISLHSAKAFKPSSVQDKDKYGIFLNGGVISGNKVTPDTLRENYALGGGICISAQSTAKISDGLITQNTAADDQGATSFAFNQQGGGVAVCEASTVTIAGGTISKNKAYEGGGIVVRGNSTMNMSGSLTVLDDEIQSSTAQGVIKENYAYRDGGGAYLGVYSGSNVNRFTMTNGWIYDNDADNGCGGAVYVGKYNGFDLSGGYIEDNTGYSDGGAIYGTQAVITISNGVIRDNVTKTGGGGGIYGYDTKVEISNGIIKNNEALAGDGGGAYIYMNTLKLYSKNAQHGELLNNTANLSGGAIYAINAKVEISDGIIQDNKATTGNGGGIFITDGELLVSGNETTYGSILNNRAPKACGGGICGTFLKKTDLDYMKVEGNSAKYGGGIYLSDCVGTTIDGGVFTKNKSNQGAGLFIRSGTSTITGGEFTWNVAGAPEKLADNTYEYLVDNYAQHGGGIAVDDLSSIVGDSWVLIKGGVISNNTAPHGGGIWLKNIGATRIGCCPNVTMEGGTITHNTAIYGGGVFVDGNGYADGDEKTSFTIMGGDISHNTANGYGGGVYATGRGAVQILENTETDTHGTISYNKAHCGGGVGVGYGATLVVENGYITYNTAFVPTNPENTPANTGYQQLVALYGAGGGVFVAEGSNAEMLSTFRLSGDNMAIYGNEAGFSGDDVFSNGKNTKLDVPLVRNMNLAGYGFSPEGWFEDYNTNDPKYTDTTTTALRMMTANEAPASVTVQRYRTANAIQRRYSHIKPDNGGNNYVRGNEDDPNATEADYNYVNKTDAYVAMTLGIPAAVDDTVVVDYGTSVKINVIDNDLFMTKDDFKNTGELGKVRPAGVSSKDGVYYSAGSMLVNGEKVDVDHLGTFYGKDLSSSYMEFGWARMNNSGAVTYKRSGYENTLNFFKEEHLSYVVKHNGSWFYANVTIIPATSIYFEDNMNQVKYHGQVDSTTDTLAEWENVGTAANKHQDEDRPGSAMIEDLDADNIYGYDGSLHLSTSYSNGSASKVTVSRDPVTKKTTNARATFTFTGTGFDIVSLCSKATGLVSVTVYEGEVVDFDNPPMTEDRCVATYLVDTHYGYAFNETTGKWELDPDNDTTLYQVPVIKADLTKVMIQMDDPDTEDVDETLYKDWGYGTYTVEIYIAPSFLEREPGYWSADFYLDAIRIYNPAGIDGVYEYQYHAVKRDSNGNPVYEDGQPVYELVTRTNKDTTVQGTYKTDGEAWPEYYELRNLFIGQQDLGVSHTNGTVFIDGNENPKLDDYKSWGPNNEVYLNPGNSMAFYLDASNEASGLDFASNVASVQLGMRGLTGTASVEVSAKAPGDKSYVQIISQEIGTTDMYYDISHKDAQGSLGIANKVVLIYNTGTTPVAISTLKVTHHDQPLKSNTFSNRLKSNLDTVKIAIEILEAGELVDPVVTPKRPALSFNGMVCYNVFFSAEELGDLTAADLGLAVFDTYDPDATVWTAQEVIYGATEIDGLYMVETGGVNAKYLGDTRYFRAFAVKADGTYVYSKMVSYSAVDYARNVLAKSSDVKLKQLVVAMLNYGAAAQQFFGYKADELMNRALTAEDQALLAGYDASNLNTVGKVDASKAGAFASTGGFTKKSPAISFNGAFEINYFFTPEYAVEGDLTMYFWNEDTYSSVSELTAENADSIVNMKPEDGRFVGASDEIAAKLLDKTVYVAAVYESEGVRYCTGVLPYSIAAYCQKPPAGVQDLANAAAIYGCTAKQYFAA